jgi:hypothetical protein
MSVGKVAYFGGLFKRCLASLEHTSYGGRLDLRPYNLNAATVLEFLFGRIDLLSNMRYYHHSADGADYLQPFSINAWEHYFRNGTVAHP